jgi:hypothetical protein
MNLALRLLALMSLTCLTSLASANLVIDTNGSPLESVNNGWLGSGQSLAVDATNNRLESIRFYFDTPSIGRTFNLSIKNSLNLGSTLFSTNFVVNGLDDTIAVDTTLLAGSTVFAEIDYLGFNGMTAYFYASNPYADGDSLFNWSGLPDSWISAPTLDHRFVAVFGPDDLHGVPEPTSLALVGLALVGAMVRRRGASVLPA